MAVTQPDAEFTQAVTVVGKKPLWPSRRSDARPVWMEEPGPAMRIAKFLVLAVIVITMLFPIVYVVSMSFSSAVDAQRGGLVLWPEHPTLDAYRAIFDGGVVTRALQISVMLTIVGTAAQMLFTTTMAYGMSRTSVLGSKVVLYIVLGALILSPGMIPSYLLVKELGMINSYSALIIPGLISAWNLIIVRNFFMNLPQELLDAAKVDGANDFQIFMQVVLPLSKAVLAVVALFYGVVIWNNFFNAILYLNDSTKWPIQVVLRQYVLMGSNLTSANEFKAGQAPPPAQTIKMAIVVAGTVPILIVYPFLQRYFTKGVLTGSIKG
ncbi:MAG TPA: carbohydrate ABC transporter permease [Thermomicrobiales bacterium]|nr:carbohydrate ABC transporter permease [Thermomicrobiales bacterium]